MVQVAVECHGRHRVGQKIAGDPRSFSEIAGQRSIGQRCEAGGQWLQPGRVDGRAVQGADHARQDVGRLVIPPGAGKVAERGTRAVFHQDRAAVSGQDAELPSVKSILAGEQTTTIFKDTRELAKVTAGMVDAVLGGKQPEINDTKTYNNGVKIVPSYLLKPVLVDASNWKQVLVGSGYYTEAQLK